MGPWQTGFQAFYAGVRYDEKKRLPGEGMEAWLSRLGSLYEQLDADERGLTLQELRTMRRNCAHVFVTDPKTSGLIDVCEHCGEGRA